MSMQIRNKDHFSQLLAQIDQRLGQEDRPLHQRPIHAFTELAKMIDPKGTFASTESQITHENDFSNDAICARVNAWYREHYGDRIKVHPGPGNILLMIRGEPWKAVLPLCYGRVQFTVDKTLRGKRKDLPRSGQIRTLNVLDQIEAMPQSLAALLTDSEAEEIVRTFVKGLNQIQGLRDLHDAPFMAEAGSDYDTALNCIFDKTPNYGNSKWASLQFAEKTIKSKLETNNLTFPRTHNLSALAAWLQPLNITVPSAPLQAIQCEAGVRYGEIAITKSEAILALQKALEVFDTVIRPDAYEIPN